ncbi:hypothetical protein ASG54_07945 [Aureimonas sp. Leaf460]|nr:hypothetical protein ASG62_14095 [Aureimonas sp. Leaf427]KQT80485.1 hypothetical protein ASG54_07945 [Aureimonas sp. Leaf460]
MRLRAHGLKMAATLVALLSSGAAAMAADCRADPEPGLDWGGCNRSNIMIPGSNLEKADLRGADFSLSDLSGAVLAGANAQGAKLARTSLAGAIADAADFTQIEGYRTNFSGLSAKGASFDGAELQRANFNGAVLTGASFEKAELGRADFTGAILGENGFAFANLARASFKNARIESPLDFSRAYMFLTRIEGADLSAAKGLTQPQIDLACGDEATKLPTGLNPPANWPCPFD